MMSLRILRVIFSGLLLALLFLRSLRLGRSHPNNNLVFSIVNGPLLTSSTES